MITRGETGLRLRLREKSRLRFRLRSRKFLTSASALTFFIALPLALILTFISVVSSAADIKPKRVATENGIILLILERHSLPIVNINMIIKAGSIYESDEKTGLSSLVATLLDEGTKTRSSAQISEEIDFVGGSLSTFAGDDSSGASLRVLKKDLSLGLDLLSDILLNPTFPDAEIERKKADMIGGLIAEKDEPGVVAVKSFNEIIFGSHPYHRPANGREDTIPGITRDDIVAYYERFYRPNNIIMALVGDITEPEAVEAVNRYFGRWGKKEINLPVIPKVPVLEKRAVKLIDKDLTQASVIFGHIGIERSNPDYYNLVVMNYILGGGGFSSRMMKNIRDNQGLVYGIHSNFDASLYPGSFAVSLQTKNETANRAIEEVLKEIKRIREEPVSDQELEEARSYLIGSFPLRIDTNSKIASVLTSIEYYGLGLDYFDRYPKLIGSVTRADITRVAKRYLDPERYAIVVVAKQSEAKIKE